MTFTGQASFSLHPHLLTWFSLLPLCTGGGLWKNTELLLLCALLLASEVPLSPECVGGINPEAETG